MSNLQRGNLCNTCNAIFAADKPPFAIFWSTQHHGSIKDLETAAEARCYICLRLWEFMKSVDGSSELPEYQVCPQHGSSFRVLFKLGKREYGFSFIDETEANNSGMQTHLSSSLRSEQSMHQARSWIQDCDEHHPGCHKQRISNARLPTRLIRVRRVDQKLNAHLCENDSLPVTGTPYLTLSHCWGKIKFMTLTEKRLPRFRKRIPVEKLSNTFQDALYVVAELGFEYIWIDSLCIVQRSDRNKDWKKEAKTMSDIYKNAACNLAVEPPPPDASLLASAQIRDDDTLEFPNPTLREAWDQVVMPTSVQNHKLGQLSELIPNPIPFSMLYAGRLLPDVDPLTQLSSPIGHSRRTRVREAARDIRSRSYANITELARMSSIRSNKTDTASLGYRFERQPEPAVSDIIKAEPQQAIPVIPEFVGRLQNESVVASNIPVKKKHAQPTPAGFLVDRQQTDLVPPSIRVNWNEGKGPLQQYKGRQFVVSESDPFQETWSGTLSTRGWVLQEQILAARILHFGRHQINWECQHGNGLANEIWPRGKLEEHDKVSTLRHRARGLEVQWEATLTSPILWNTCATSHKIHNLRCKQLPAFDIWTEIITNYSRRYLSHASDQLPALMGIVSSFGQTLCDDNVFGLWRGDLVRNLLWSQSYPVSMAKCTPDWSRAPSWSWASSSIPVEWYVLKASDRFKVMCDSLEIEVDSKFPTPSILYTGRRVSLHLNHLVELSSKNRQNSTCRVQYDDHSSYDFKRLIAKGDHRLWILEFTLDQCYYSKFLSASHYVQGAPTFQTPRLPDFMDCLDAVTLLPMIYLPHTRTMHGLVVVPLGRGGNGPFRRVGVVSYHLKESKKLETLEDEMDLEFQSLEGRTDTITIV